MIINQESDEILPQGNLHKQDDQKYKHIVLYILRL